MLLSDEELILCGRDVCIYIDGKLLIQAESLEIRKRSEIHSIRCCFMSEDAGHIRKNIAYKAVINGITFKRPFENCGFSDLDNFTLRAEADGKSYILTGCMWDDFFIAADKERFREHISVIALRLRTETENEGT